MVLNLSNRIKLVIAALSGALTVFSFAPFEIYYLVFVCLGILFYLWQDASARFSALLGFVFGLGMFCAGVSWVYISLSTYGGMPLWMGSIAVLGFASVVSIGIAGAAYFSACLIPAGGSPRLALIPFCWVLGEWFKSWFLSGFAWLDMGYTQTPSPLFALAPIGGVYFISLAVTALSACLVCTILMTKKWKPAVFALGIVAVSFFADQIQWSTPIGEPIKVGIAQGNVPIDRKWQLQYRDGVIDKLVRLNQTINAEQVADLIVWPETALPLVLQQTDAEFWNSLIKDKSALLTGVVDSPVAQDSSAEALYNAAVLYCSPDQQQIYRKRHLVPFGEYLPLRFLFDWVLEYLQLPMSDFSSWQGQQTLSCGDRFSLGLSICYEDAFAAEVRAYSGDANVLVNISEDAWFGDSFAPHQRLQMGQMRARELAKPMVRSANSGPSAFLDERGRVLAQTAQFEVATLVQTVQPQAGDTIFQRFGNWVVYLSGFVLLLLSVKRLKSRRAS